MAIFDIFSKRQKKLRGDIPDVYTYDQLPNALKVQIVHIWTDALGNDQQYYDYSYGKRVASAYKFIVDTLCREYGVFKLPTADKHGDRMYLNEVANYLLQENNVEKQLDVVELSFKVIDHSTRRYDYLGRHDASQRADNALIELNNSN